MSGLGEGRAAVKLSQPYRRVHVPTSAGGSVWRGCRGEGGGRVCEGLQGGQEVPGLRDVPAAGGAHHDWGARRGAADHGAGVLDGVKAVGSEADRSKRRWLGDAADTCCWRDHANGRLLLPPPLALLDSGCSCCCRAGWARPASPRFAPSWRSCCSTLRAACWATPRVRTLRIMLPLSWRSSSPGLFGGGASTASQQPCCAD